MFLAEPQDHWKDTEMTIKSAQRPQDDPEQAQRFIDTAKGLGADENADAMDKALKRVSPKNHHPPPKK